MKILITGATGFIGRNLYKELKKEHDIHVLVRESSNVSVFDPRDVYVFTGDIENLKQYLDSEKIEGIIHMATLYVNAHKSEQIKDIILSNIYLGTAVLEAASIAGVKWFINIGTIWQNYNVPDYSDEYNPVNLYAATKQAFMTVARYYTETTPIRFCTLKLCDTYGEGDTRKKIMDLFKENAQTGKLLEMSAGEQLIDIVHISTVIDSVKQLVLLISNDNQIVQSEYTVTSGQHISLRDLAKQFEKDNNVKLNIHWGARPYRDREVMRPYIGTPILTGPYMKENGNAVLTKVNRGGGRS